MEGYSNYFQSNNQNFVPANFNLNGIKNQYGLLLDRNHEIGWKVSLGLFITQTIVALIQLIIAINSSAIACQAICCPTISSKRQIPNKSIPEINSIHIQELKPRTIPRSSSIPEVPFAYKTPQDLIYLSSTHASVGVEMKVHSTFNHPDIY